MAAIARDHPYLPLHSRGEEKLWLYQVEEMVLMVEVKPSHPDPASTIGQVVLKRLMSAEDVLTYLCTTPAIAKIQVERTSPSGDRP